MLLLISLKILVGDFLAKSSWLLLRFYFPSISWILMQKVDSMPILPCWKHNIVFKKSLVMKFWRYLLYKMRRRLTWELHFSRSLCKQFINRLWNFLWHVIMWLICGLICLLVLCYNINCQIISSWWKFGGSVKHKW
jgi:hypothetical protein